MSAEEAKITRKYSNRHVYPDTTEQTKAKGKRTRILNVQIEETGR